MSSYISDAAAVTINMIAVSNWPILAGWNPLTTLTCHSISECGDFAYLSPAPAAI